MNFSSDFNKINEVIVFTKYGLKHSDYFPSDCRREFNQALDSVLELLQKDRWYVKSTESWKTVYRIVHLNKLKIKLQKIRNRIFELPIPPYFSKKINDRVIPVLSERISTLKTSMEIRNQLPFSIGIDRGQFFEDVKQQLQLKNIQNINQAQKEYFHLLGNYFEDDNLKKVDIESLNGSLELKSFISWEHVLDLFVQEGDALEKSVGSSLLSIIKQAIPLAIKTSFAYSLPHLYFKDEDLEEKDYFEDYLESHQPKESSTLSKNEFLDKYKLNECSRTPQRAIISEMVWDMVNSISSLKLAETKIFAIGTIEHRVIVQVTCTHEDAPSSQNSQVTSKVYEYKIFNTGYGVNYHQQDTTKNFARPIIFQNVSSSAFSYSFCSTLLRLSLMYTSIDKFYQLHDQVLVTEAGGKKDLLSGALYPLQKHGICAYTSVEAFIFSYLTKEQIKHFEIAKAKISTNKQKKVVKILECTTDTSKPTYFDALTDSKKLVKYNQFRESEILLNLGQQFLKNNIM